MNNTEENVLSKIEMRRKEFRRINREKRIEMHKKMSNLSAGKTTEKPSLINNKKINKIISDNNKEKYNSIKRIIIELLNEPPENIANMIVDKIKNI